MSCSCWPAYVKRWPAELQEELEERAAIIEDGCQVDRREAEKRAFWMLYPRAQETIGSALKNNGDDGPIPPSPPHRE